MGGGIVTCPPPPSLGAEGALMNGRRSDPLDALSVQNDVIFGGKRPKFMKLELFYLINAYN